MRVKTGKAKPKYLRIFIFLLFLFLSEAFPKAALAFTSLNACARSKECLELIKGSSSSAVSAPTGAGFGSSTLSTTTSSGTVRTLVKGVTDFAIFTAPTAAYVGWHYWNEAHNGRAQDRAKELYCAAHPNDLVCTPFTGGQCEGVGYEYGWEAEFVSSDGQSYGYSGSTAGQLYWSYAVWGQIKGIRAVGNTIEVLARGRYGGQFMPDFVWVSSYSTGNTTTLRNARFRNIIRWDRNADNCGNPPPLPWKDWSQAKRDAAVALLSDSDWQNFITSMPEGGTLNPGDTVNAPKIVIPGQEEDNPDTLGDDRQLKTVPGQHTRIPYPDNDNDTNPDSSDPDDDDDGIPDLYDTLPLNPYPIASSDDDSLISEPGEPTVGSPEHKAQRWAEYQQSGGTWDYERWSNVYDANISRAREANAAVDAYHQEIRWGQRELTVDVDGESRRLDIADISAKRGVEYKTGYAYASEENLSEVRRDKALTQKGWIIEWVFEGSASEPLLQALRDAGIFYKFR